MEQPEFDVLERQVAFQGYFRVDRYRLRHRLFGGGWSETITREVFERGHSVAVLPYDPVADAVVLIEQFRAGALAAGRNPWLIECVAGIIDDGETPRQVARREAQEEVGSTLGRVEPIAEFLYSSGACSEVCRLFVGEIDSRGATGIHGKPEEHEDIRVLVVPADAALEWLDNGKADNAALLIALSWLARHRDRLRSRWRVPAEPDAEAMT